MNEVASSMRLRGQLIIYCNRFILKAEVPALEYNYIEE